MTKNEKSTMIEALGKSAVLANFYARAFEKYADDDSAREVSRKRAKQNAEKVNTIIELMRALGFNVERQITTLQSGLVVNNMITVDGWLVIGSRNDGAEQ